MPLALDPEVLDQLAEQECVVLPNYLPPDEIIALRTEVAARLRDQAMLPAQIGRGSQRQRRTEVRGDLIHWLDASTMPQQRLFACFEQIRQQVNASLWLGLFEFEAHYAWYPPGTGYQRHLDAFQHDNPRRLSAVLYLNRVWPSHSGGELVIYSPSGEEQQRVRPEAGTLVLFLSQRIPHEVLPATRGRASIATWFRVRAL